MSDTTRPLVGGCPRCGVELSPDVAAGLCPACLLAVALEPDLPLGPGDVLDGKYRLNRLLGRGGMGAVFLATHVVLGRTVAVKLMLGRHASEHAFLKLFRTEAAALGAIKHPNVVDVIDFGVVQGPVPLPYLVMQYLEGETLEARLRNRGALPFATLMPILDAIARAVDFMHARGMLHRDLKPANVFLTSDGTGGTEVRLLDFGLARFVDASEGATPGARPTGLSGPVPQAPAAIRASRLVGTPGYLAPELLGLQRATVQSDVYAFGVLAYYAITGRLPIDDAGGGHGARPGSSAPALPSGVLPVLPPELDEALLAPLSTLPEERPPSAGAVLDRIRERAHAAAKRRWRVHETPRRVGMSVTLGVLAALAAPAITRLGPVKLLEARLIDARFALVPQRDVDPRLLLVSIDEPTLAADSRPLASRADEMGRELTQILEAGADAIAIDFLLPSAWSESESFSRLLVQFPERVTLAALSTASGAVIGLECVAAVTASALGPSRTSALFGFVNVEPDTDGVLRRARGAHATLDGSQHPAWAAHAAATIRPPPALMARGQMFWIDHSGAWERIPRLSWMHLRKTLEEQPSRFHGRLVLVGGDFEGSGDDRHRIPRAREAGISGLLIQALITDTLLTGTPVKDVFPLGWHAVVATLGSAVSLCLLTVRRGRTAAAAALVALVTLPAISVFLFVSSRLVATIAAPLGALAVVALAAWALRLILPPFPVLLRRLT